jgi:hypothetical protein
MRVLIILAILGVAGIIFVFAYAVKPRALSPAELTQVRSSCSECHSVPQYQNANEVHDAHPELFCTVCHIGDPKEVQINFQACQDCHGTPQYTQVIDMHDAHGGQECLVCHDNINSLSTANRAREALKWAGTGLVGLVIAGIAVNFAVAKIRLR